MHCHGCTLPLKKVLMPDCFSKTFLINCYKNCGFEHDMCQVQIFSECTLRHTDGQGVEAADHDPIFFPLDGIIVYPSKRVG